MTAPRPRVLSGRVNGAIMKGVAGRVNEVIDARACQGREVTKCPPTPIFFGDYTKTRAVDVGQGRGVIGTSHKHLCSEVYIALEVRLGDVREGDCNSFDREG